MQNIWGRSSESALSGEELRDEVQLHLARHLGDPHIAFSDNDGWAGNSREPGPAVDVLVVPPEGERRFAYVCTFGSSLKKRPGDITGGRMEFALAVPQHGDPQSDLAVLNLGANTVRQFAKLDIQLEVRAAWLGLAEARARIGASREAVDQAEENLRISRELYGAGLATNTQVLDAVALRVGATANRDDAVLDTELARLALARAIGDL